MTAKQLHDKLGALIARGHGTRPVVMWIGTERAAVDSAFAALDDGDIAVPARGARCDCIALESDSADEA